MVAEPSSSSSPASAPSSVYIKSTPCSYNRHIFTFHLCEAMLGISSDGPCLLPRRPSAMAAAAAAGAALLLLPLVVEL